MVLTGVRCSKMSSPPPVPRELSFAGPLGIVREQGRSGRITNTNSWRCES